ncbi:MAG: hypothetical protein JKY67_15525 [Pseudomonadales bacterium]|nr:hypothetical protein [Pseudomonadales bacterium]
MTLLIHKKKGALFFCLSCLLILSISFINTASAADQKRQALQIQELKLQLEKLENEIKRNKQKAKQSLRKIQKRQRTVQFRGFFSAGVATADDKALLRLINDNQEIGDEPNFQSDSIVGLQLDAVINDKTRYTHQMTTVGYDINHTVKTEWAYFSYKLSANTSIKAGRLRIPFFLLSESLEVGYTYPWVRTPVEIYNLPVSGYEGATLTHQFDLGIGYAQATVYAGSAISSVSALIDAIMKTTDTIGTSFDYNFHDFQIHLSYLRSNGSFTPNKPCDESSVITFIGDVLAGSEFDLSSVDCPGVETLSIAFGIIDQVLAADPENLLISELYSPEYWSAEYVNIAFKYDNGSSLLLAEYGVVDIKGYLNPLGPSGYVLYGLRIRQWMPYFAIGSMVTSDRTKRDVKAMSDRVTSGIGGTAGSVLFNLLRDSGVLSKSRSYTLGANYWINNNLRAKAEIVHYENFGETIGFFLSDPGSHSAIYSVAIDGVF